MTGLETIKKLSDAALFEQLAEECVELAHASLKMARKLRNENPTPKTIEEIYDSVIEELADVTLTSSILIELDNLDATSIENLANEKARRWIKRLEKHFNEKGEN